jgi:hypothetical protein
MLMEPIRRCPYCAEEILIAAVKCKHCQSELALASAPALPETRELELPPHPESIAIRAASFAPPQPMIAGSQPSVRVDFNARRAATQVELAAFNSKMKGFLAFEVFVAALIVGFHFQSLAAGLAAFVGMLCASFNKECQQPLALLFSVAWGALAGLLVHAMDPSEPIAWFLAGGFALALSMGAHYAAFQWMRDFE